MTFKTITIVLICFNLFTGKKIDYLVGIDPTSRYTQDSKCTSYVFFKMRRRLSWIMWSLWGPSWDKIAVIDFFYWIEQTVHFIEIEITPKLCFRGHWGPHPFIFQDCSRAGNVKRSIDNSEDASGENHVTGNELQTSTAEIDQGDPSSGKQNNKDDEKHTKPNRREDEAGGKEGKCC